MLPADIAPEVAVAEFLSIFGAAMEEEVAFTDAACLTKALFQDGKWEFKWLADADQEQRLQYLNLLAMSLIEPDEIWWYWEHDRGKKVVGG